MSQSPRRRRPDWVYGAGDEPDPRFTLANERTFLAWIRTSLALIAGGVALEALELDLQPDLRLAASILLIVAGSALAITCWFDWGATERALRRRLPLPAPAPSLPTVAVVIVAAALVLLAALLR